MKENQEYQAILLALNLSSSRVKKKLSTRDASKLTKSLDTAQSTDIQLAMSGFIEAVEITMSSSMGRTSFYGNLRSLGIDPQGKKIKIIGQFLSKKSEPEERQLVVCPVDPSHYSKPEPNSDTILECPLHKTPLVRYQ